MDQLSILVILEEADMVVGKVVCLIGATFIEICKSETYCHGGRSPFYFGTTNLGCTWGRRKRYTYESVSTIRLTHRYFYYRGYYLEFTPSGPSIRTDHPLWPHCDAELDDDPAGYSSLEVDCLLKCARKYVQRKGRYNALTNNCHHFANYMSLLLCTVQQGYCWTWCLD